MEPGLAHPHQLTSVRPCNLWKQQCPYLPKISVISASDVDEPRFVINNVDPGGNLTRDLLSLELTL